MIKINSQSSYFKKGLSITIVTLLAISLLIGFNVQAAQTTAIDTSIDEISKCVNIRNNTLQKQSERREYTNNIVLLRNYYQSEPALAQSIDYNGLNEEELYKKLQRRSENLVHLEKKLINYNCGDAIKSMREIRTLKSNYDEGFKQLTNLYEAYKAASTEKKPTNYIVTNSNTTAPNIILY
jgi:hypothetical protein